MKLRGSLLVIVCCLVVEFYNVNQKEYMSFDMYLPVRLLLLAELGLLFLLYPLVGHLTDVYLTRYRSLKWSFGLLIVVGCITIVYIGVIMVAEAIWEVTIAHHGQAFIPIGVIFIINFVGFKQMPFSLDWISY